MAKRLSVAVAAVERNGVARKRPVAKRPSRPAGGWARRGITLVLGCGIPGCSLALSSIGGRLCTEGQTALGVAALALCCSVLAVSLSHLAWAVEDITHSARWQAWCLAVTVDLAVVLCELAAVAGAAWWLVYAVQVAVTGASALLNCWAFLAHR
jgi:hypothetical protein